MPVIVVANPKGGVGKSTLSTQIAGYLAWRGHRVMLGDIDRQQSARHWLSLRPAALPRIEAWEVARDDIVRPPRGTTHVVLDTPAGLHGKRLDSVMKLADKLLVPLQPSLFDIQATHDFLQQLVERRKAGKLQIALVGMRSREGTLSTEHLREFLAGVSVPLLGFVRDTQNYVHLAAHGLSLWDVASGRVERDLAQWQPITAWLEV